MTSLACHFLYNRKVKLSYYIKKYNAHNSFRIGARTMDADIVMNHNNLNKKNPLLFSHIKDKTA